MGKGPYEIERRYLVRVRPGFWDTLGHGLALQQAYLRSHGPSVRIRTGEPRGPVLTSKTGRGIKRREVEAVVPLEMAEALFLAAGPRVIRKVRHALGPWELDRFEADLEGLVLLEVELEHEDDAVPVAPEGVDVLREVTDDNRFTSGHLAHLDEQERRALVRQVYHEVSR